MEFKIFGETLPVVILTWRRLYTGKNNRSRTLLYGNRWSSSGI